jgi:ATP-dependent DNA ligase
MFESFEILEGVARGKARSDKLADLLSQDPYLEKWLNYSLSPDITFGIKKIPEFVICRNGGYSSKEKAFGLLDDLAARTLTGNAASKTVKDILEEMPELDSKWFTRVLHKDLRLNIDAKTVNKIKPGAIKLFSVALAEPLKKAKDHHLEGVWALQPKLDGGRCVAKLGKDGTVTLFSRTGKEWKNFESIRKTLERYNQIRVAKNGYDTTIYLDGEVISKVNGQIDFQALQSTMHAKKRGTEIGTLEYVVFDSALENEWLGPRWAYKDRRLFAQVTVCDFLLSGDISDYCKIIHIGEVMDNVIRDHGLDAEEWRDCLGDRRVFLQRAEKLSKLGLEGLIVRRLDCPVELDRSFKLLKVKLVENDEAEVIGSYEGEGRMVGMLGGLECKAKNGVIFRIGSGFSDSQRIEFWNGRDELIGRMVSYNYMELTNDAVPRHPIFKYFRHKYDL